MTIRLSTVSLLAAASGRAGGAGPGASGSGTVSINPDPSLLPGSNLLHTLTNGLAGWALIAAAVGMVIGAVMWAFGSYSQNYQTAYNGRRGVLVSALAAIIIGAAPTIVNQLVTTGGQIK